MRFYVLEPEGEMFGARWAYGDVVDPVYRGDAYRCPVCQGPISMLRWLPPHRLKLSSSRPEKWGDFLWGAGFDLMVSARFRSVYESEGLTGITLFYPPAEIAQVGTKKAPCLGQEVPVYHLVEVLRDGANLDDHASGVVRRNAECSYDRGSVKALQRIVIESESWEGADLFVARGLPGTFLVSERFKAVVEAHGLRNLLLIPAERYAYDEKRPGLWYVRDGEL